VHLRQNRPGASSVPSRVETSRRVLVTDLVTAVESMFCTPVTNVLDMPALLIVMRRLCNCPLQ